ADIGGRPRRTPVPDSVPLVDTWTQERLLVERARVLRRLGRVGDAAETWDALAAGPGRLAAIAAIELAKLQEHAFRDPRAAIRSLERAWRVVDRRRRLAMPEPGLEADLVRRGRRLRLALARSAA
ncbi:MAG TPA: hypothetical protein VEY67_12225, partial [Candidatus Dormibacteraeota bacterium]|nr:hypothetical protein [Candidatus Dormibacteraeota bacterium]